jgi:hypothetical protein
MGDPSGHFVLHSFVQYDLASCYIPVRNVPPYIVCVQIWRVIEKRRGCVGADAEDVNIGNVSVDMIDDSNKLRIGRPLRVDRTIVLLQKHACIARVRAMQEELHSAAVLIGRDRVSLERAVRRDEAMLARECFSDQQDRNRGKQSTHRPNEKEISHGRASRQTP